MKKILVSIATTLMAATVLVACNASDSGNGENASDVSSSGAAPAGRGVCTSLANWQSVGVGMSAGQVESSLGKPAKIISNAASTEYHYEKCRGFVKVATEATEPTQPVAGPPRVPGIPGKPTTYEWVDVEGVVTISGARGVTATSSPIRITDKIVCEFDYYRYPEATVLLRTKTITFNDNSTATVDAQYIPNQYCRSPADGTQF